MTHEEKECRGGAGAPCIVSGMCPVCCNCELHVEKRKQRKARRGEKGAKGENAPCPRCGGVFEFMAGHVMAGCEGKGA